MTYRNFEIDPHWFEGFVFTHEDYDGAPDANDSRTGSAKSIDACKRAIDQYYFESTEYRVGVSVFCFITDAIQYALESGQIVEPRFEFDSI